MSWTHSSKVAVVAFLAVSLAAVGTAAALSASAESVPSKSKVGTDVSATFVIEDPFTDSDQWTLHAETELRNVNWNVRVLDQGEEVSETPHGEQSWNQTLDKAGGGDKIVIELQGTTPKVDRYSYKPKQTFTVARLVKITGGARTEIEQWSAYHYTSDSKKARNAIDAAGQAIEAAGGNAEAEQTRQNAIAAYENESFGLATNLANEAKSKAQSAQQSQQTMQLAMYGVGALVVLGLIGGGIYYWKSQQGPSQKLK